MGFFDKKDKITKGITYANEYIVNTFLSLTNKTYPYGFEDGLVDEMTKNGILPSGIEKDMHGNYFYKIGESRTMFASHFDTVSREQKDVTHIFEGKMIKTNGTTTLGADDKAGVTIMLYMIKNNIPGLYYFFIGEEVGCIGSGLAAKYLPFKGKYDRCISFDRRGTDSVITYQSSSRCCSDEFAQELASELNKSGLCYSGDDSGVYTDSAEFVSEIPECTNLSVGYYNEHTFTETQDIEHLSKLAEACLKVDWESLITKRDMNINDYKSWGYDHWSNVSGYNRTSSSGYHSSRSSRTKSKGWGNHDYGWASYSDHDDFYHDDIKVKQKRTRRSNKKVDSREYYDLGHGELGVIDISKNIYEWTKYKILDDFLTRDELEVVKDQYLDMSNVDDSNFYHMIKEGLS